MAEAPLNVREEAWYGRYYQTVEYAINNLHRKYPNATIYLMGIEGDVQWGKRTLQEWKFLQEDIDHVFSHINADLVFLTVSLENLNHLP